MQVEREKAEAGNLLLRALRDPGSLASASVSEWDLVIRQARRADLLARLAFELQDCGLERDGSTPAAAAMHLRAARTIAAAHAREVRWELRCIRHALAGLDCPVVVLKGAAYLMAELPPARGRLFSDIDIMVPKAALDSVERALKDRGWISAHPDPYDQRYYRRWMHELPPLHHVKRRTVLDVHHTILPPTARLHPDVGKLFADAQPLPGGARLMALSPVDMVLHSAAHLFHDGELENGLRDLTDLHGLLWHFARDDGFWEVLVERAVEMELIRPLFYALRYSDRLLSMQVPDEVWPAASEGRPRTAVLAFMDMLFSRALLPDHRSCDGRLTPLARWLLYVRSHALRMPIHLLLPHLTRKYLRRFQPEAE